MNKIEAFWPRFSVKFGVFNRWKAAKRVADGKSGWLWRWLLDDFGGVLRAFLEVPENRHFQYLKIGVTQTYDGGVTHTYGRGVTQTDFEAVEGVGVLGFAFEGTYSGKLK